MKRGDIGAVIAELLVRSSYLRKGVSRVDEQDFVFLRCDKNILLIRDHIVVPPCSNSKKVAA